jgi:hypothetical protein
VTRALHLAAMAGLLAAVGCGQGYDPASAQVSIPGLAPLLAAHNCYDEAPAGAPDRVFAEALALGFGNIELDVQTDVWRTPRPHDGQATLYVRHDCTPSPDVNDLASYLDRLARHVAGRDDALPLVLTIDVKDCHDTAPRVVAASLAVLLDRHAGLLTEHDPRPAVVTIERAVTVCLTGDDRVKDAYRELAATSGRPLRAFADRVISGTPFAHDPADYFTGEDNTYRRFRAVHWKHVEPGFPGGEGEWTAADRARLDALLDAADAHGVSLRFYALNGRSRSYRFAGGMRAAVERWQAFTAAAGGRPRRHFLATDDRRTAAALAAR